MFVISVIFKKKQKHHPRFAELHWSHFYGWKLLNKPIIFSGQGILAWSSPQHSDLQSNINFKKKKNFCCKEFLIFSVAFFAFCFLIVKHDTAPTVSLTGHWRQIHPGHVTSSSGQHTTIHTYRVSFSFWKKLKYQ